MKTILCYGDSNTWGRNPDTRERFDHNTRWPKVTQGRLGQGFLVIEEGLVGRTTVYEDPNWEGRNGEMFLPTALESHMPLDMLIIALGANDLKSRFNLTPVEIAAGLAQLVEKARTFEFCPECISIVCPAPCSAAIYNASDEFEAAVEKSRELVEHYSKVAKCHGCGFVDAGQLVAVSETDGLHFDANSHLIIGQVLAEHILETLAD